MSADGPGSASPPPLPGAPRPVPKVWFAAAAVVMVAGAAVLYAFNPATTQILPPCPFLALTGFYCPGCGSTRAMHQLLHGRIGAAFDLNPLVVVLLPFVVVGLAREARRLWSPPRARRGASLPRWLTWTLPVIVVLFGVMRNLPWKPVRWMAP